MPKVAHVPGETLKLGDSLPVLGAQGASDATHQGSDVRVCGTKRDVHTGSVVSSDHDLQVLPPPLDSPPLTDTAKSMKCEYVDVRSDVTLFFLFSEKGRMALLKKRDLHLPRCILSRLPSEAGRAYRACHPDRSARPTPFEPYLRRLTQRAPRLSTTRKVRRVLRLVPVVIRGDGHCAFGAIVRGLTGQEFVEAQLMELRNLVVDWVTHAGQNALHPSLLGMSKADWRSRYRDTREWLGHLHQHVLACALGVQVVTYACNLNACGPPQPRTQGISGASVKVSLLLRARLVQGTRVEPFHFDYLRPVTVAQQSGQPPPSHPFTPAALMAKARSVLVPGKPAQVVCLGEADHRLLGGGRPPRRTATMQPGDKGASGSNRYDVDYVRDSRVRGGIQQYLVHWFGYSDESDEWVAASDIDGVDAFAADMKRRAATPLTSQEAECLRRVEAAFPSPITRLQMFRTAARALLLARKRVCKESVQRALESARMTRGTHCAGKPLETLFTLLEGHWEATSLPVPADAHRPAATQPCDACRALAVTVAEQTKQLLSHTAALTQLKQVHHRVLQALMEHRMTDEVKQRLVTALSQTDAPACASPERLPAGRKDVAPAPPRQPSTGAGGERQLRDGQWATADGYVSHLNQLAGEAERVLRTRQRRAGAPRGDVVAKYFSRRVSPHPLIVFGTPAAERGRIETNMAQSARQGQLRALEQHLRELKRKGRRPWRQRTRPGARPRAATTASRQPVVPSATSASPPSVAVPPAVASGAGVPTAPPNTSGAAAPPRGPQPSPRGPSSARVVRKSRLPPCHYHTAGSCRREGCRFPHVTPTTAVAPTTATAPAAPPVPAQARQQGAQQLAVQQSLPWQQWAPRVPPPAGPTWAPPPPAPWVQPPALWGPQPTPWSPPPPAWGPPPAVPLQWPLPALCPPSGWRPAPVPLAHDPHQQAIAQLQRGQAQLVRLLGQLSVRQPSDVPAEVIIPPYRGAWQERSAPQQPPPAGAPADAGGGSQ